MHLLPTLVWLVVLAAPLLAAGGLTLFDHLHHQWRARRARRTACRSA
jgi:hypothetical protein